MRQVAGKRPDGSGSSDRAESIVRGGGEGLRAGLGGDGIVCGEGTKERAVLAQKERQASGEAPPAPPLACDHRNPATPRHRAINPSPSPPLLA